MSVLNFYLLVSLVFLIRSLGFFTPAFSNKSISIKTPERMKVSSLRIALLHENI
jgi:hypothetical protein